MNKNYLLSYSYSEKEFPSKLIHEDSLKYKEFLFTDEVNKVKNNKVALDLSESFIMENESLNNVKKLQVAPINKNIPPKTNWRQNATEGNSILFVNDTVEFLRGGVIGNNSGVEEFVKGKNLQSGNNKNNFNVETTFNNENSSNNKNNNFNDTMINSSVQEQSNILGNISELDASMSQYNEYFKNNATTPNRPFPCIGMQGPMMGQMPFAPMIPIKMMPTNTATVEKISIENIFQFNKKVFISYDQPLWYLSMPWSPMLIGPVSSNGLIEMYEKRTIDSNWGIKPIDIFQFRHANQNKNEIVNLTYINNKNWADDVQDSAMLQYTELYHTSKKLIEINSNTNVTSGNKNKEKENVVSVKKLEKIEPKQNKNTQHLENETLQLTTTEIKGEIRNFYADDDTEEITPTETRNKNNYTNVMDIGKQIEEEEGDWAKIDKKKKKEKEIDPSFYLIGNKQKKETKKENKPTYKVDIVAPEDLLKELTPKHLREENKPNYDAFKAIGNQNSEQGFSKKKLKGKPQDLNVKLGFKI